MADYAACAVGGGTGDGGFFTSGQQDDYPTVVALNYSANLGADITNPVVTNIVRTGEPYPTATLQFDVTDESGFHSLFVLADFPEAGAPELIHDGTTFSDLYLRDSTRTAIANGFRYYLVRWGGWPKSSAGDINILIYPRDTGGNTSS